MKSVEIIIPAYKPGKDLKRLLYGLCRQNYPIVKIRIVNTDKGYWKDELIEDALKTGIAIEIMHIEKADFDHGGTRAMMAKSSQADYLLFMTQDAYPKNPYLVQNLVKAFNGDSVGAAYARQLPKKGCSLLECQTRAFNYPEQSSVKSRKDLPKLGIKTYFCSNVCAMYRRDIYLEQGGFITHTIFNEDMIFAAGLIEAGYEIAYAADALVYHSHNYTLSQYFRRSFDMAVSQASFPHIFSKVKSESEGMRLVKTVTEKLYKEKRYLEIPMFFMQCAVKYAGFFLGKHYEKLPEEIVLLCSDNKGFWAK